MSNNFQYQLTVYDKSIKIEDGDGNYLIRERKPWEIYDENFLTVMIFELNDEIRTQNKLKGRE
jgi:hypothetical protein